jgi:CRP-like cAMP-binding protein
MTFPYRFAFKNNHRVFKIIDGLIDIVFLFDLIFHFFYSYIDKRQRLVNTFRPIFMRYLFGTMIFDILALYPYYFGSNETLYVLKIFRYVRIGEMLSGITECLDSLFLKIKNNMNFSLSITRIINFAILLGLIGQVFGSIWYYIGEINITEYDEGWIKYFLVKDGVRADQTTIYITSIYWVFTTLSTLGYGDYFPVVRNEYLFTMSIEFMGVFLFAYMMGNINVLIEKLDDDHNEYIENEFEVLDQWLMKIDRANPKKRLNQERVDKIRGSLKTYWEKDHSSIQKGDFLHQLPVELKSELINHLFKNFMDSTFRIFFTGLEEKFKQEIVVNLYPRKYQKNEEIIPIDSGAKNLYFIVKGKVTISSKEKIMDYVELQEGSYFGDYLIFFRLRSSNAFIAEEDVELMCIKKKKFLEICEMFSTSAKQLKYRAFLRRKFVRKQKKAIEEMNKQNAMRQEIEHNNKIINQLSGGVVNINASKNIPEVKSSQKG